jgi:hypothetical protein
MVRIRYVLEADSRLVSKPIESALGVFRTAIERNTEGVFEYWASRRHGSGEFEKWEIVAGGRSKNLTVAKNKVKLLLKSQGVEFLDEVRRRGER